MNELEKAKWAAVLHCSQCGGKLADRACGPTHAVLKAYPSRHRDFPKDVGDGL